MLNISGVWLFESETKMQFLYIVINIFGHLKIKLWDNYQRDNWNFYVFIYFEHILIFFKICVHLKDKFPGWILWNIHFFKIINILVTKNLLNILFSSEIPVFGKFQVIIWTWRSGRNIDYKFWRTRQTNCVS